MIYNGEHLLPGQIGHFFGILSLVASLLATISYLIVNYQTKGSIEEKKWLQFSRLFFFLETISVLAVFSVLYYIISNHYHEYFYAWNHSSRSLQLRYILACFWEGSEGSFLLWSFWHCVLGWVIIWKNKKFEAPVLFIISFAQFCLATMVVGVYFWGHKVGTNPFILWREQTPQMPIFSNPDYLQYPRVFEGNDLNVLLQNYWMVIHPPVLFLGFASTIIPFAFAISGLMRKSTDWIKPALPWAVFSGAILGLGIMMGGAWAYESLSFGGYWAWDPVENASLVPWLVMIAGLHTNLIFKSTGYSLRSNYVFYILSFCLILYSTFLTRSGILGDTSVHAFTESGMNVQLYLFLNVFVWVPTLLAATKSNMRIAIFASFLILNILSLYYPVFTLVAMATAFGWFAYLLKDHVPVINKEESNYSREFWMFIASMIFFLAGIIIIAKTSVPIYNKIFNQNIAPPEDREFEYNRVQVFIAIVIGILTAVTQYLKYKMTDDRYFGRKIFRSTVLSVCIAAFISIRGNISYDRQGMGFLIAIHVAIFAAVYAIVANANYIVKVLKGNMKLAGASLSHIGFGMVLLGILISSSKKTILSNNVTGIAVFQKSKMEDPAENITLFKGIPTDMGKYMVTYANDTFNNYERKRFFKIDFKSKYSKETFSVYPDIAKNNKGMEGFAANPDSKHYLTKDVFVYISAFEENKKDDTATFRNNAMKVGDTTFYSNGMLVLNSIKLNPTDIPSRAISQDTTLILEMTVITKDGRKFPAYPGITLHNNTMDQLTDTVIAQNLVLKFNKMVDPKEGKIEVGVKESKALTNLVTLKVIEFPMINLLWLGVIVMVLGMVFSVIQRLKIDKRTQKIG